MNEFCIFKLGQENIGFAPSPFVELTKTRFPVGNIQNVYLVPKSLKTIFFDGIIHMTAQRIPFNIEVISNNNLIHVIHNAWISKMESKLPIPMITFEYERHYTYNPEICPDLQEYQQFISQLQKHYNLKIFW